MVAKQDHITLNYIERGSRTKTSILFLHFFGGSSHTWLPVMKELENDFHCIAADLCGWGDSVAPGKEISVQDNAEYVIELIKELKLTDFILTGHSMGGKIALYIASQIPDSIKSLILIAPSPPTPEPMTEEERNNLAAAFGKRNEIEKLVNKITSRPLSDLLFENVILDHLRASRTGWESWTEKGSREDISGLMPDITAPVLLISGGDDPNFSSRFLHDEFIRYFPDASFEEIARSGHLIPSEDPEQVANLIKNFHQTG